MSAVHLAAVGIAVPEPQRTADFLREMLEFEIVPDGKGAFDVTAEGEYGLGVPPRMLTLRPGSELAVTELVFEGDVEQELRDPEGLLVRVTRRAAPLDRSLAPSDVRPRRLGHVNLSVREPAREAAFYVERLGLRLSEQIGDIIFFLRAGSDHHNFGLRAGAERPTVHHVAFEIAGWESFRTICDRVAARGHVVEYGPGRHGPGHNLFVYLVDPSSGLRLELFADMAHIDDEDAYEVVRWTSADRVRTVNRWGPQPPDSFLR